MDNLDELAREEGLVFCPRQFTTNSRKALLLAEAAKEEGADIFYRLHRRLFESFFTEGRNIGDESVLRDLANEAGVSARTVQRAWTEEHYVQRLELIWRPRSNWGCAPLRRYSSGSSSAWTAPCPGPTFSRPRVRVSRRSSRVEGECCPAKHESFFMQERACPRMY